jgi:hypothetical protein
MYSSTGQQQPSGRRQASGVRTQPTRQDYQVYISAGLRPYMHCRKPQCYPIEVLYAKDVFKKEWINLLPSNKAQHPKPACPTCGDNLSTPSTHFGNCDKILARVYSEGLSPKLEPFFKYVRGYWVPLLHGATERERPNLPEMVREYRVRKRSQTFVDTINGWTLPNGTRINLVTASDLAAVTQGGGNALGQQAAGSQLLGSSVSGPTGQQGRVGQKRRADTSAEGTGSATSAPRQRSQNLSTAGTSLSGASLFGNQEHDQENARRAEEDQRRRRELEEATYDANYNYHDVIPLQSGQVQQNPSSRVRAPITSQLGQTDGGIAAPHPPTGSIKGVHSTQGYRLPSSSGRSLPNPQPSRGRQSSGHLLKQSLPRQASRGQGTESLERRNLGRPVQGSSTHGSVQRQEAMQDRQTIGGRTHSEQLQDDQVQGGWYHRGFDSHDFGREHRERNGRARCFQPSNVPDIRKSSARRKTTKDNTLTPKTSSSSSTNGTKKPEKKDKGKERK